MTKDDAVAYATEAHGSQLYGDKPYTYHLDEVAKKYLYLFRECATEGGVIVSYLHDVLEDAGKTEEDLLRAGFSSGVVHCVSKLTRWPYLSKEHYIRDLVALRCNPTILSVAWQVKVADTLSNLEHSMKEENNRRIDKYTKQLRALYY